MKIRNVWERFVRRGFNNDNWESISTSDGIGRYRNFIMMVCAIALISGWLHIMDVFYSDTVEAAIHLFENSQLEASYVSFERAIGIKPDEPRPYLGKAIIEYERNDYDEALKTIDVLLTKHPGNLSIVYSLAGMIYRDKKEYGNAVKLFSEAIDNMRENDFDLYRKRAEALYELDKNEMAFEDYRIYLSGGEDTDEDFESWINYGYTAGAIGKCKLAASIFYYVLLSTNDKEQKAYAEKMHAAGLDREKCGVSQALEADA